MGGTYSGIREMRKAYRIVVRKYRGKKTHSLNRPRDRREDNIKVGI